jgi:phage FluMu protein Com
MLKITCFKCHWSWSLNQEAAQAALESLKPGEEHFTIECPRCRRVNKVTVHQLKQALPRVTPPADSPDAKQ